MVLTLNNAIVPVLEYGNKEIEKINHINIAYGVDINFLMPMGVSITSIVNHNKKTNFIFYVLTDNIAALPTDKIKLLGVENVLLKIYDVDKILSIKFGDVPVNMNITKSTWYRFLLADIVSKEDRVLYIDADIICQGDISNIYALEMDYKIVAAIKDRGDIAAEQKHALQMQNEYFNAGVMLIDLFNWREFNTTQKSMEYLKNNFKLRFLDQDVLNKVLDGKINYISDVYNFFYWPEKAKKIKLPNNVVFIHFTAEKPWWIWVEHKAMPIFMNYKNLSPWKNDPLPLPNNYKQCKSMAKYCKKYKYTKSSIYWYMQYFLMKIKYKKQLICNKFKISS